MLGLVACNGVERDLHHAEQGRHSAAATARFTAEAWARGDIKARFARLAFDAARQRVEADRQALAARAPQASDDRVPTAIRAEEDLSAALAALVETAERGDKGGIGEPLARAEKAAQ